MPTDDFDDEFDDADGRSETNTVRELRKALKSKDKQFNELKAQFDAISKSTRERSVKDVLKGKGLPEKIAAFIPESATTSEDVEAWLTEYGDVFGAQAKGDEPDAVQQQSAPDANAEALARISGAQATGQPFSNDPAQLASRIASAQSPEELNQLLFGNPVGPPAF